MGKLDYLQINVNQYYAFEFDLKKLKTFAIHIKIENYKSIIFQNIIDDFVNDLQEYLNDEISILFAMRS